MSTNSVTGIHISHFNTTLETIRSNDFTTVSGSDTSFPFKGEDIDPVARIIFLVIGSLEVIGGVAGNCLLITVLLLRRSLRMRSFHNLFIANLAMADLLSQGYWMTFFVLDLILGRHPVLNSAHCDGNAFLVSVCIAVSVLTLVTISLDRFLHVCHTSLYSRVFTRTRIKLCCISTWLLAATFATPPLFGIGSYHYDKLSHTCTVSTASKHMYINICVVTICLVPMCFVGYWNFAIFRNWKKARMSVRTRYPLVEEEKKRRRDLLNFGGSGLRKRDRKQTNQLRDKVDQAFVGAADELGGQDRAGNRDAYPETLSDGMQERGLWEQSFPPEDEPEVDEIREMRYQTSPTSRAIMKRLRRRLRKERARERAFVRSLFVVFLLMAVTFTPYAVLTILGSINISVPSEIAISTSLLLFSNCSVNWIVYGVMNRSIRRGYAKHVKRVLGTCCRRVCPRFLEEDVETTTTFTASGQRSITDCDYSFTSPEQSSQM